MFCLENSQRVTYIWSTGQRIRTYGQYLARQVSVKFSIDPAEGVEPIPGASKATFPAEKIAIEEKNQAIIRVKKETADFILWCDGSESDEGGTGAAVAWKENGVNGIWQERKAPLGKNKEILEA